MNEFDTDLHKKILSADGTYTAYSKEYDEHYHSTKDGALHESLVKHVIPAFEIHKNKDDIKILDICFGLGFNTLATLYYIEKENISTKVKIYSPELDAKLIESLDMFTYPKEFENYLHIIHKLVKEKKYSDQQISIELFIGDAREYILGFEEGYFDVVYQDAFSPNANPILWTEEYFRDIKKIIKKDGAITTYSTALATRLALYNNGFGVYLNQGEEFRNATLASLSTIKGIKKVDMEHKISCNPEAQPLRD